MKYPVNISICLGLITLCLFSGCAGSRGFGKWFAKNQSDSDESAIQALLASQQQSARQQSQGEDSIYPPAVVQQEPLPKTEKDLKNPLQLHLSYAKLQEQLGHLTEARLSYEKVVSKEPKSVTAIIGLARLDALAGRNQEAEKRFRQAISISPKSSEAYYSFGQFLAQQDRDTEAIVELQKALQLQPASRQYMFTLGVELAKSEQYDEAKMMLEQAVGEAEALYNIGYVAWSEHQNWQLADQYLREALQLNPELKQARYWLAQLQRKQPEGVQQVTATQTAPLAPNKIRHATGTMPNQQQGASGVIPASTPPGVRPEDLTPEQWEQWKNQAQSR